MRCLPTQNGFNYTVTSPACTATSLTRSRQYVTSINACLIFALLLARSNVLDVTLVLHGINCLESYREHLAKFVAAVLWFSY
jgi:hypothetical protein